MRWYTLRTAYTSIMNMNLRKNIKRPPRPHGDMYTGPHISFLRPQLTVRPSDLSISFKSTDGEQSSSPKSGAISTHGTECESDVFTNEHICILWILEKWRFDADNAWQGILATSLTSALSMNLFSKRAATRSVANRSNHPQQHPVRQ